LSSTRGRQGSHHRPERLRQVVAGAALVGVWQPLRGSVRLDGAALDQWSPDALGAHIGYLRKTSSCSPHGGAEHRPLRAEPDNEPSLPPQGGRRA